MRIKSILLLIPILLIVSFIESKAQNNNRFEHKNQNALVFNMGLFDLLHLIEDNLPLTRQKIENMGFELAKVREKEGITDYTATPVKLADGIRLVNIDLWERSDELGEHTFFILDIKNKMIMRQELENHLGEFVFLPEDHIALGKTAMYGKLVRESEFTALYTREPENILLNVSFYSTEPSEQSSSDPGLTYREFYRRRGAK